MKYNKLIPPDSFIGQYMQYMSVVETAESYDFWCAVWAMGVGCGRSVYVGRPNAPVYLNWYIILAAESGETRKSTAISSITDVIGDEQEFLKGKTSPEALELILHEHTRTKGSAAISMAVSELVTILGREGYMSTMPGLLTDLYDCPSYRNSPGTIKSGEIIQKDVYVNFISASTPAWLVTAINPSVIEGGFTSRVIFVVDDTRKRAIAWPEERNSEDKLRLVKVYNDSIVNARAEGVLKISTGGLKTFKHWYINKSNHTDPFLSSFEAREDDHILRLAAILCINDGTLEIQHSHIKNSIKIVSDVKSKANNLFGGDFSQKARITGAVTRVREILMDSGTDGIKHSDLQRRVVRHTDAKELRMLINIMHECGMLSIFKMKRGEMYRANQAIEKLGVTTEVLSKLNC